MSPVSHVWVLVDNNGSDLVRLEFGKTYYFGRSVKGKKAENVVDLGIKHGKVSRKQLQCEVRTDGLHCKNIGLNSIRFLEAKETKGLSRPVFRRTRRGQNQNKQVSESKSTSSEAEGVKYRHGDQFVWYDGDSVEFSFQHVGENRIRLRADGMPEDRHRHVRNFPHELKHAKLQDGENKELTEKEQKSKDDSMEIDEDDSGLGKRKGKEKGKGKGKGKLTVEKGMSKLAINVKNIGNVINEEGLSPLHPGARSAMDSNADDETASIAAEAAASLGAGVDIQDIGMSSPGGSQTKEIMENILKSSPKRQPANSNMTADVLELPHKIEAEKSPNETAKVHSSRDLAIDTRRNSLDSTGSRTSKKSHSPSGSPRRLWTAQNSGHSGYRRWPSQGSISPNSLNQQGSYSRQNSFGLKLLGGPETSPIPFCDNVGNMDGNMEGSGKGTITSDRCPFPSNSEENAKELKEEKEEKIEKVEKVEKLEENETEKTKPSPQPVEVTSENGPRIGLDFQAKLPAYLPKPKRVQTGAKGKINDSVEKKNEDVEEESEDETRDWTEDDKSAFDRGMRDFTKDFSAMARQIPNFYKKNKKSHELVNYYYRRYKKSEPYKQWKAYMSGDSYDEGIQTRERRARQQAKDKDSENGSRPPSRTSNDKAAAISSIKDLIDAGLVLPGKGVLKLAYQGRNFAADLDAEGVISCKGIEYSSVSSWSVAMKRKINTKLRGDNGWTSVHYSGKSLEKYREDVERNRRFTETKTMENYTLHTTVIEDLLARGELKSGSRVVRLHTSKGNKVWHASLREKGSLLEDIFSGKKFETVVDWCIFRGLFTGKNARKKASLKTIWTELSVRKGRDSYKPLRHWRKVWKRLQNLSEQGQEVAGMGSNNGDLSDEGEENGDYESYHHESDKSQTYCKCGKRESEDDETAWYIQCSKATGTCNGWVHPACFQLEITRTEGEKISEFICPLCSADGHEHVSFLGKSGSIESPDDSITEEERKEKELAQYSSSVTGRKHDRDNDENETDDHLNIENKSIKPGSKKKAKVEGSGDVPKSASVSGKVGEQLKEAGKHSENDSKEENISSDDMEVDSNGMAEIMYPPGTMIRTIVEFPEGRPLGWFLARILEVDTECHPEAPYRIAYGFDPSITEWTSFGANQPTRMLAGDWNKSKCYRDQDIRWRTLASQASVHRS